MNYVGQKGMVIDNKFAIGDTVYVVTDSQQDECIVTAIIVHPEQITYQISKNGHVMGVYDFEITKEKNITAMVTNG